MINLVHELNSYAINPTLVERCRKKWQHFKMDREMITNANIDANKQWENGTKIISSSPSNDL